MKLLAILSISVLLLSFSVLANEITTDLLETHTPEEIQQVLAGTTVSLNDETVPLVESIYPLQVENIEYVFKNGDSFETTELRIDMGETIGTSDSLITLEEDRVVVANAQKGDLETHFTKGDLLVRDSGVIETPSSEEEIQTEGFTFAGDVDAFCLDLSLCNYDSFILNEPNLVSFQLVEGSHTIETTPVNKNVNLFRGTRGDVTLRGEDTVVFWNDPYPRSQRGLSFNSGTFVYQNDEGPTIKTKIKPLQKKLQVNIIYTSEEAARAAEEFGDFVVGIFREE